jgi:CCR4-NOT complex subunit CAF16
MHQLSDGQRRRVQIFLGLIRPFQILCLDEITTSLDVVVRQDLLRWLVKESDERGATIVYATHIFDGLDDWATHLMYLSDQGRVGWQGRMDELELYKELQRTQHPAKMLAIAEHWLRGELAERRLKRQREKAMGAAALLEEMDVTDRNQGGYSSGRLRTKDEDTEDKRKREAVMARNAPPAAAPSTASSAPTRAGRLSDVMGNRGVLDKVARVAGD